MKKIIYIMLLLSASTLSYFSQAQAVGYSHVKDVNINSQDLQLVNNTLYIFAESNTEEIISELSPKIYLADLTDGTQLSGDKYIYRLVETDRHYLQCINKKYIYAIELPRDIDRAYLHDYSHYLLLSTIEASSENGYVEELRLISGCKDMKVIGTKIINHSKGSYSSLFHRCLTNYEGESYIATFQNEQLVIHSLDNEERYSADLNRSGYSLTSCLTDDDQLYFTYGMKLFKWDMRKKQLSAIAPILDEVMTSKDSVKSVLSVMPARSAISTMIEKINSTILVVYSYKNQLYLWCSEDQKSISISEDLVSESEMLGRFTIDRTNHLIILNQNYKLYYFDYSGDCS